MIDERREEVTLSHNIERLLRQRYYDSDSEGWEGLVYRVVSHVCADDPVLSKQAYNDMYERVWLPNSPCLVNAGKEKNSGLFACFLAGPGKDSLSTHLDTLKDIAQVAKFGGGCGFTGTFVRAKNKPVAGSTHGYSYGPCAYALRVSDYMDMMTQAGFRKMALMFTMRSDHDDLDEFIDMKQENERLGYNFNQSVMATDEWMGRATYNSDSPESKQLDKVVYNAWNNGEPGLLFHSTINRNTPYKDTIEATNPCVAKGTLVNTPDGLVPVEQISVGDDICTLSDDGYESVESIEYHRDKPVFLVTFSDGGKQEVTISHRYKVVLNNGSVTDSPLYTLKKGTKIQVDCRFRDGDIACNSSNVYYVKIKSIDYYNKKADVYDLYCSGSDTWITDGYVQRGCGEQPLPEMGSCNLGSINVGHDRFFNEDGTYKFEALVSVIKTITKFLDNIGSQNVFPNEAYEDWYNNHRPVGVGIMGYADTLLRLNLKYGSEAAIDFLSQIMSITYKVASDESFKLGSYRGIPDGCKHVQRRNITLVTIAPTGSIGLIAGCSHGIEPVFSPIYNRTDERGETYLFEHALKDTDWFMSAINDDNSKIVSWKEHIDTQLAAQTLCDSGVSKTINFPNDTTVEEVREAFIYAWQNGAKGLTVYRNQSRQTQVLESITENDNQACVNGVCEV